MHWNGSRWSLIFVEALGVDVFQYTDWLMLKLSSQVYRGYWQLVSEQECFIGVGGWGSKINLFVYPKSSDIDGLGDILRVSLVDLLDH